MKKRFFLDRVDMNTTGKTIGNGTQLAVKVNPDAAISPLSLLDPAPLRAQFALDKHNYSLRRSMAKSTKNNSLAQYPNLLYNLNSNFKFAIEQLSF